MASPDEKTRVQLDFSPRALARLQSLKERTEAVSYAEVVKDALKIYDYLVSEAGESARIVFHRPDGTTEMVKVFP